MTVAKIENNLSNPERASALIEFDYTELVVLGNALYFMSKTMKDQKIKELDFEINSVWNMIKYGRIMPETVKRYYFKESLDTQTEGQLLWNDPTTNKK
jgi:hypothetical protein